MNRLERIAETLHINKVDFDEDFVYLDARGYASDGCQELSEKIVSDVEKLAVRAVNGDFGAKEREAVADLVRLALKLSDKKAAAKLVKYSDQREKIIESVRETERREGKMDIREETLKFIDLTRRGTEVIRRMDVGDRLGALFDESIGLLGEIRTAVEDTWDNSTKSAADLAGSVTDEIVAFQKKLSVYTCDADAVEGLRRALARAKEWQKLNTAAKRGRDIADDKYIDQKVGFTDPYNIGNIIESEKHIENIYIFRDTLKRFNEDTERMCGTDALEEERGRLYRRSGEIEKELDSLTVQYMNGEMSAEECDGRSSDLEEEKADIAAEIEDCRYEIDSKTEMRKMREASSKEFAKLSEKIMQYEHDPSMLSILAENVDFAELCGALLGRMNGSEIKAIVNKILSVFDMVRLHGGFTEDVRDAWREIRSELHMEQQQRRRERKTSVPEQAQKNAESEAERRMQERIARMQKRQDAAQQGTADRAKEERRSGYIPLSDSDK